MISKKELKSLASSLMFEINDDVCNDIQKNLLAIINDVDMMNKLDELKNIKPMTFPFITYKNKLRDDVALESLNIDDVIKNSSSSYLDQVKVPKVVE